MELKSPKERIRTLKTVLAVREAELLELLGPCYNQQCYLHQAHQGPCKEKRWDNEQ